LKTIQKSKLLEESNLEYSNSLTIRRFMSSEADLDADIKALSILSEHSELYAEFAKLGCINSLVALLSHENTDIAIDVVEVIDELTDEDVEAEQGEWDTLVNAMVKQPSIPKGTSTEVGIAGSGFAGSFDTKFISL
jgi:beta-catenin-like protein 1